MVVSTASRGERRVTRPVHVRRTWDLLNPWDGPIPDEMMEQIPPVDILDDGPLGEEEWDDLCDRMNKVERCEIEALGGQEEIKVAERTAVGLAPVDIPRPLRAPLSHYKHGAGLTADAKLERIDVLGKKAVKKQRFQSQMLGV